MLKHRTARLITGVKTNPRLSSNVDFVFH